MNLNPNNCARGAHRSDAARVHRLLTALIAGAALCLASAGVEAQVTAVAGGNPSNIALSIPVTASIASRCSFAGGAAPGGSYANADIRAGFSHAFLFALQCNSASRVAVQSANGGLLAAESFIPSGYTNLAPYQVKLVLVGDPGVATSSATCDVQTLSPAAAAPCSFRGPASTSQGLALVGTASNAQGSYLQVSAQAYAGTAIALASTTYLDTLTITVSAAM